AVALALAAGGAVLAARTFLGGDRPVERPARMPLPAGCPDTEFGCVMVGPGEAIRIGSILTISGETASLGLDSQHGIELALDYRDGTFDGTPGQVAGHDVEFQHEDGGCHAEGGAAAAGRLASGPTIAAVMGTSCSSEALGAADAILSDEGIILISPSNTSPALTDPATRQPFYFRTAYNDELQGAAAAQFAAEELGATTAATIHDGSPYADGLQQVFCDVFSGQYGGECTAQEAVRIGSRDFAPLLTSIAADAPDVLFYPIFLPEGGLITAQARQNPGLADTALVGADGLLTPGFIDSAGEENAEGVYLSGSRPEVSGSFYEEQLLPAYVDRFGEEPTAAFHAHAFDAANMVFDAIDAVAIETEAGGLLIPRTELRDVLGQISGFQGITGNITCDENGDCQPTARIAIYVVEQGRFRSVFERVVGIE
ncbi:MAG: branched-chain amino acid ABC transporter substrate-binding protein, partial [Actinomycetota bacterium]